MITVCGLEPHAAIVNRATMMGQHGQHSSCINTLSPLSLHSGRCLWCGRVETDALKAMHASNAAFWECSLPPHSVSISFSPSLCPSIHSRLKWMRSTGHRCTYWHHSPQLTEFLKSGGCPKPAAVCADLFIYIFRLFLLCLIWAARPNQSHSIDRWGNYVCGTGVALRSVRWITLNSHYFPFGHPDHLFWIK